MGEEAQKVSRFSLAEAFNDLDQLEEKRKLAAEDIREAVDGYCQHFNVSRKAFMAAYKWHGMKSDERREFLAAIEMAEGNTQQSDLFDREFERSMKGARLSAV